MNVEEKGISNQIAQISKEKLEKALVPVVMKMNKPPHPLVMKMKVMKKVRMKLPT